LEEGVHGGAHRESLAVVSRDVAREVKDQVDALAQPPALVARRKGVPSIEGVEQAADVS
jgi:phosphohistidine swiveling domain-containing protein